uniref:Calponin-homology (CH) domain-containing protein n=1 Tax=Arcella intermedia TaxID=1963864 RepID=A0A6B2KXU5_9EUKA
MDAEQYLKMKSKEDPEWERKVGEWIEDVLGRSIEDTSDLFKSLKSGVVLCHLINAIKPGTITKFNDKPTLHVLMERENINLYLDACYRLGVPKDGLFVTSDLHGRRNIAGVLSNIRALSQIAGRWGIKVPPLGNAQVNLDALKSNRPASKWAVPTNTGPVMAGELQEDADSLEVQLEKTKKLLDETNMKLQKSEASNATLKQDVQNLREQVRGKGGDVSSPTSPVGKSEIETLRKQLIEVEAKKKQLEIQLLEQSKGNPQVEQNLRTEIENLKKQLQAKSPPSSSPQTQQAQTPSRNEQNLRNEIEALKKQLQQQQNKPLGPSQNEVNLRSQVETLKNEVESLKKQQLNKAQNVSSQADRNEIESLKKQLQEYKNQPKPQTTSTSDQTLRNEIETLKKMVETKNSNITALQSELVALKQKIADYERRKPSTSQSPASDNDLKFENTTLKKEIEAVKKENNELKYQIQSLSNMNIEPYDGMDEELDAKDLKKLEIAISQIVNFNTVYDIDEVADLQHVLKLDGGRRQFTFLLKEQLESIPDKGKLELNPNNFESLVYLFNKALDCMDPSNGADYISAKIIHELSHKIQRVVVVDKETVRDNVEVLIKRHPVWQNIDFWREYFWDLMSVKFKKVVDEMSVGGEYSTKQKEFLIKHLSKFTMGIYGWGELPPEAIDLFTESMAMEIGLSEAQIADMLKKQAKNWKKMDKSKENLDKFDPPAKTEKSKQEKAKEKEKVEKLMVPHKAKEDKTKSAKDQKKLEKTDKPKHKSEREKPKQLLTSPRTITNQPAPPRPSKLSPHRCDKCEGTFKSVYELNLHKSQCPKK